MPAFRILDPFPAYTNNQNAPVSGGELRFYDTGTTTPRSVYGDKALTVDLGSTVTLDTSGRTNSDIWGDGAYRVRLYDSLGALIDEADNVEIAGGTAEALPAMQAGKFLTSDGSVLSWADIREVPDPTGQANKVLSTDGTALIWIPKPADGAPGASPPSSVTRTAGKFVAGTHMEQFGAGTAPSTGLNNTSVNIVFPTAFATIEGVWLQVDVALVNGIAGVSTGVTNRTLTGFTANFDIADRHSLNSFITAPIPFTWRAVGTVAA